MSYQYFGGPVSALSSNACVLDTTAPTFSGVTSVTPETDGSFDIAWGAATDSTPPIDFLVYGGLGTLTAGALFVPGNLIAVVPSGNTQGRVFTLADHETYFVKGEAYTFGVRARDAVGNINTNVAVSTSTAIASGGLPDSLQLTADQLQTIVDALAVTASQVAGGGGTQLSIESASTVMSIETDGVP